MDRIIPSLKKDYEYWRKKFEDPNRYGGQDTISIDDVLRAHYLICDYFYHEGEVVAVSGPRNITLLESALSRQFSAYGGTDKWKTKMEKTASLFYGLVKNHPFHDGNKRTGMLIALYNITKINRTPKSPQKYFELLTINTAANKLNEYSYYSDYRKKHNEHDARVYTIARLLEKYTRESDSRFYSVTYNQLASILPDFGYKLSNPSGNYIDVIREEKVVKRKIWKTVKETKEIFITKIGFPGWTREVTVKDIQKLRRETDLTTRNGVDSQVFFKGADPLAVLISRFHKPLLRLKDR